MNILTPLYNLNLELSTNFTDSPSTSFDDGLYQPKSEKNLIFTQTTD
jgi:hypothetical protein